MSSAQWAALEVEDRDRERVCDSDGDCSWEDDCDTETSFVDLDYELQVTCAAE